MHGSFEKPGETDESIYRSWGIGIYALPVLFVIALVAFAMTHPGASNWISDAAQAEFVGTDLVPDLAPVQVAKPAMEIRTVKAF